MGPGDGTLMGDVLRAAAPRPGLRAPPPTSGWSRPAARCATAPAGPGSGDRRAGPTTLAERPAAAPLILVANELLDCLPAAPVRAHRRTGWAERRGRPGRRRRPRPSACAGPPPSPRLPGDAPLGAVVEQSPAQAALGAELGARIARHGGAALFIDYGRDAPGFGDTLQALHAPPEGRPAGQPGEADLTVHVDFPAVAAARREAGARTRRS